MRVNSAPTLSTTRSPGQNYGSSANDWARIRKGIKTASIVIADLTQARPNVYLEVGYAWGHGTRVIFLARKGEDLHFNVSGHRCIYYANSVSLPQSLNNFCVDLRLREKFKL